MLTRRALIALVGTLPFLKGLRLSASPSTQVGQASAPLHYCQYGHVAFRWRTTPVAGMVVSADDIEGIDGRRWRNGEVATCLECGAPPVPAMDGVVWQ
jgi:hypothetical protein